MKVGPKYKICKRLGGGIFEKCQTQQYALSEAKRGKLARGGRRPRGMSDFGRQLLEKQKIRYAYGLGERQLTRYVKEAGERASNPAAGLYETLERRLDNVVYRLGLAKTRRLARQMVSHGHITVGGRKVTVPSYIVDEGDDIAVREGSKNKTLFANMEERLKEYKQPSWLVFDEKKLAGSVKGRPDVENVDSIFDLGAVLEFYSR